jgi:hypothetical protein
MGQLYEVRVSAQLQAKAELQISTVINLNDITQLDPMFLKNSFLSVRKCLESKGQVHCNF